MLAQRGEILILQERLTKAARVVGELQKRVEALEKAKPARKPRRMAPGARQRITIGPPDFVFEGITDGDLEAYRALGVDVEKEILKAQAWVRMRWRSEKLAVRKDWAKFLTNWLGKEPETEEPTPEEELCAEKERRGTEDLDRMVKDDVYFRNAVEAVRMDWGEEKAEALIRRVEERRGVQRVSPNLKGVDS